MDCGAQRLHNKSPDLGYCWAGAIPGHYFCVGIHLPFTFISTLCRMGDSLLAHLFCINLLTHPFYFTLLILILEYILMLCSKFIHKKYAFSLKHKKHHNLKELLKIFCVLPKTEAKLIFIIASID